MNIKILETKLQTILEDDDFLITEENLLDKLEIELEKLLIKVARFNDISENIEWIKANYLNDFNSFEYMSEFKSTIEKLISVLEKESFIDADIYLNLINEMFINQELYDAVKIKTPSIIEVVDKLNLSENKLDLDKLNEYFNSELDNLTEQDLSEVTFYEYLNNIFDKINIKYAIANKIMIVSNKKDE